jgi:hypothetical protein
MSKSSISRGAVACVSLFLAAAAAFGQAERKPAPGPAQRIRITIGWGDARKECRGGNGICIIIATGKCAAPARMQGASVEAEARPAGDEIGLELTSAPPHRAERVQVGRDILVDACTSGALGYDSLMILKGDYAVDYSASRLGRITVNVRGKRASAPSKM